MASLPKERRTPEYTRTLPVVAAGLLAACGMALDSSGAKVSAGSGPGPRTDGQDSVCVGNICYAPLVATEAVPRAVCGPGSMPETGIQGEVPAADRQSGRSLQPYTCNLEKVGQYEHGEGSTWSFAWYDDCGYLTSVPGEERQTKQGLTVVDASDPAHPVETAVLETEGVLYPHEDLKVHERRALMAAHEGANDVPGAVAPYFLDVYDVSQCAQPRLLVSMETPDTFGHEGEWAQDGRTYYSSSTWKESEEATVGSSYVNAYDLDDPANPKLLAHWAMPQAPGVEGNPDDSKTGTIHGLSLNHDGTRGYFTVLPTTIQGTATQPTGGLWIVNTSDVQSRRPDPQFRIVSGLFWPDLFPQMSIPIIKDGRPYVIVVEEGLGIKIIDVSDEFHPRSVSDIKLEVHLVNNWANRSASTSFNDLLGYITHYCHPDRFVDPTALACGVGRSGIRVFDIRDLTYPKELAYFNPGALPDKPSSGGYGFTPADGTTDFCANKVRFVEERGELWTSCVQNEMLILKFTNGVWPFPKGSPPLE